MSEGKVSWFAMKDAVLSLEERLDKRTKELRELEATVRLLDDVGIVDDLHADVRQLAARVAALESQLKELTGVDPRVAAIVEKTGVPADSVAAVIQALDEVEHGNPGSH